MGELVVRCHGPRREDRLRDVVACKILFVTVGGASSLVRRLGLYLLYYEFQLTGSVRDARERRFPTVPARSDVRRASVPFFFPFP
jgi:hypothetical protein